LHEQANTKLLGNLTTFGFEERYSYGVFALGIDMEHHIRPEYRYLGPDNDIKFYLHVTERSNDSNQVYPIYGGKWSPGIDLYGGSRYSFTSSNGLTRFGGGVEIGQTIHDSTFDLLPNFPGLEQGQTNVYHSYTIWDAYFRQLVPIGGAWWLSLRAGVTLFTGEPPLQKLLFVNGANPSEQDRSVFWKDITSISSHFSQHAHFFMESGSGARGYLNAIGTSDGGGGFNVELNMPNPLSSLGWLPNSIKPLLFFDADYGTIPNGSGGNYQKMLGDAGIGFKLDLLSWLPWQLQGVTEEYSNIPKIGIYFPIWLSTPNDGKSNVAFRYVISVGTTF
jgi:hypothetical protein